MFSVIIRYSYNEHQMIFSVTNVGFCVDLNVSLFFISCYIDLIAPIHLVFIKTFPWYMYMFNMSVPFVFNVCLIEIMK